MSFSIQTNVNSLVAQENLRVNNEFQSRTINRLTSGYRINSSSDDAAGLAVSNKYRGDIQELTQGVRNANDGISALQIVDGGLNNISKTLDRLRTLATQSASATFTGSRVTLNNEYTSLLTEITRQASNIGLVSGGQYNTNITVFIGGGSSQANSKVGVDLSGSPNRVDASSLGIGSSAITGGGTTIGNVDLTGTSAVITANQSFTFHVYDSDIGTTGDVAVTVTAGSGITGAAALTQLNSALGSYGISAATDSSGYLVFGGTRAFSSTTGATAGGLRTTSATSIVNTGDYNYTVAAFATNNGAQTLTFQNAGGSANVTLADGTTRANTIAAINTQTAALGIYAITDGTGAGISLQSSSDYSLVGTAATAGGIFNGAGTSATITDPAAAATATGNAEAALALLGTAVTNLGLVQGRVGTGQNKLQYAVQLAQSQISAFSAAESRIRDADVASEAANLTKAQVLQQASLAALAQANSAPQAVLALLRG